MNVHDGSDTGAKIGRSMAAFTIGLSEISDGPELIFVDESSESISEFINKYLFYKKIGLPIEDIIEFTSLDREKAKYGTVDKKIAERFMPQMYDYFRDKTNSNYYPEVIWIGKHCRTYPFYKFIECHDQMKMTNIGSSTIN